MSKNTENAANSKPLEPESSSTTTGAIIPPRPLMNKRSSSGHNIYSSMVRKTSEKTLYGDRADSNNQKKKNTFTESLKVISHPEEVYISKLNTASANPASLSRSGSFKQPQTNDGALKKELLLKQQMINSVPTSSTPVNQKPPTGILNHVSTPARSRAGTFNTLGDADMSFIDDSGLKTPVSAIQFQFEDKIPLRRLPHQHRGSMTPRINMLNPIETSDTSNDMVNGSQMARTRSNSQSKKLLTTPSSITQTGSRSSSAATSATASGNNNSSFLSVSINDIVAQLTGKVENTKPSRNQSAMKIPGGFGDDDDDDDDAPQAQKSSAADTSKSTAEFPNGRKTSPQLTTINNLINRSANSSSTSLKDDIEIECKPTKQRIFEYLPKQDDDKFHILLGATGSVATIKIPLIVNKLLKYYTPEKCSIQVVLTQASLKFIRGLKISPLVKIWTDDDLTFLSNQPYKLGDPILQVELRRWADVFVVAPLSANTLAKISNGISDNLLTNIIRGWPITSTPLYLAPAMNTFMYIHPLTKIHLNTIKELYPSAEILKPVEKVLVCGDIGMGGMREWTDICALVINKLDEMKRDEAENASDEEEEDDEEEDDESLLNRDETDDEDHSEDGEED